MAVYCMTKRCTILWIVKMEKIGKLDTLKGTTTWCSQRVGVLASGRSPSSAPRYQVICCLMRSGEVWYAVIWVSSYLYRANILVDSAWTAKIADFGFSIEIPRVSCHVMSWLYYLQVQSWDMESGLHRTRGDEWADIWQEWCDVMWCIFLSEIAWLAQVRRWLLRLVHMRSTATHYIIAYIQYIRAL